MKRREFLAAAAAPVLADRKPNILLILADDLGYADLGCYGSRDIETPHLDRLAAEGVRFTQGYSASAVCSPTRAACLTGRFPLRFDIRKAFSDHEEHLAPAAVTLPRLLKPHGYLSSHVGKWHLGGLNRKHLANRKASIPGPLEQGFDHYTCFAEDPAERAPLVKGRGLFLRGTRHIVRDDKAVEPFDQHLMDFWTAESIRRMEEARAAGKPFFVNCWFDAPHFPYDPAPEPHLAKYGTRAKGDDRIYRSMVSHMDECVGRMMAALSRMGLEKDTLVLFTSDNGPAMQGDPGPFQGKKADLHEGGIRVPWIVRWTGKAKPRTSEMVVQTVDCVPTICAAAGVAAPANVDGVNLLPHLLEGRTSNRSPLFWQLDLMMTTWQAGDGPRPYSKPQPYATEALRDGDWKLLSAEGKALGLYHLAHDAGERTNLLDRERPRAERMSAAVRRILAEPRIRGHADAQ